LSHVAAFFASKLSSHPPKLTMKEAWRTGSLGPIAVILATSQLKIYKLTSNRIAV
jgi:hypothetical protein